jgi:hypothetical protein
VNGDKHEGEILLKSGWAFKRVGGWGLEVGEKEWKRVGMTTEFP